MRTFKLVLGYDGTDYHGWQAQPERRTVQGAVELALRSVLVDEPVKLEGAGRTDAGVHARGQVASFDSRTRLPARALPPLLNRALPADIRVRSAEEQAPGFHARRSAVARRYAYRVLRGDDVLLRRFAWHPGRGFDLDRLELATRPLEGERDFSAFQAAGSSRPVPLCRVARAGWSVEGRIAGFEIVADHFLYRMVRTIVGTAVAVAATHDPAGTMAEIIASRERGRAGITAPARGLCLEEVFYTREAST